MFSCFRCGWVVPVMWSWRLQEHQKRNQYCCSSHSYQLGHGECSVRWRCSYNRICYKLCSVIILIIHSLKLTFWYSLFSTESAQQRCAEREGQGEWTWTWPNGEYCFFWFLIFKHVLTPLFWAYKVFLLCSQVVNLFGLQLLSLSWRFLIKFLLSFYADLLGWSWLFEMYKSLHGILLSGINIAKQSLCIILVKKHMGISGRHFERLLRSMPGNSEFIILICTCIFYYIVFSTCMGDWLRL